MENAYFIQLISYSGLLKSEGIRFREDAKCLVSGEIGTAAGFALFISCRTIDTPNMLRRVLPLLKSLKVGFRLIKDQNLQYRLNSGGFGDEESGKVLSIFPPDTEGLKSLILQIIENTTCFKGPVVGNAQRLGNVLYIQQAWCEGNEIKLSMPGAKQLPINIPLEYRKKPRINAILGGFYLPVQLLRSAVKGNIYKGINLRKFAFNWCLIKQGNPVAFDDHFDRDMKDRLLWQREIITALQSDVNTPVYLDYFEKYDQCYLVLGFAEGESLGHTVRELLVGTEWKQIETKKKERILKWYLNVIDLIGSIHSKGIVHCDITDSNFIILEDDSLCIIDFELSYSLNLQQPNPPFLLGTFGYASPEQLRYLFPDIKDDIYSLGALLCFMLTGCPPHEFLNTTLQIVRTKIKRLSGSELLASLVVKCLQGSRKDRPNILYIKENIENYLETLTRKKDETFAMAV